MTILHWLVMCLLGLYGWRIDNIAVRTGFAVFTLVLGATAATGAATVPLLVGLGGAVLMYLAAWDLRRFSERVRDWGPRDMAPVSKVVWIGCFAVTAGVGGWAVIEASFHLP